MSPFARVDSIPAIKQFRASLCKFVQTATAAVDEGTLEIQRTQTWLLQDRYRYWKTRVRERTEQYTQAKQALIGRQIFERAVQGGVSSSCVDERKALKEAEVRLREAERRFSYVRSWIAEIDKELNDYKSRVKGLISAVEVDVPNALAGLDRMVDALEAYLALAPPEARMEVEPTAKDGVLWTPQDGDAQVKRDHVE